MGYIDKTPASRINKAYILQWAGSGTAAYAPAPPCWSGWQEESTSWKGAAMPEQRFEGRGILSDVHKRVVDVKGRDSRRDVDRFESLMQFYADRLIIPEVWWTKH
jgi:hypothetical protein